MPRRIAAALTATLVAVTLVALGGPAHAVAPSHQSTAVSSHACAMPATARALHVEKLGGHHVAPPYLDLASTPPSEHASVRTTSATRSPISSDARVGRDIAAPTGRAPPAL